MAQDNKPWYSQAFANRGMSWSVFFDDFQDLYALTSNQPVSASSPWIGTALSSGTFAQTTAENFGVAVLGAAATTDNSGTQIQGDFAGFGLVLGKRIEMETRLKISDATQTEFFFGLGVVDTTFLDGTGTLAGGLTHTGSVGFYKPDGETNIYALSRASSANVLTSGFSGLADATYLRLGMSIDMDPVTANRGLFAWYLNGVQMGTATVDANTTSQLTPTVAMNSGDALGTKTLNLDYVWYAQER